MHNRSRLIQWYSKLTMRIVACITLLEVKIIIFHWIMIIPLVPVHITYIISWGVGYVDDCIVLSQTWAWTYIYDTEVWGIYLYDLGIPSLSWSNVYNIKHGCGTDIISYVNDLLLKFLGIPKLYSLKFEYNTMYLEILGFCVSMNIGIYIYIGEWVKKRWEGGCFCTNYVVSKYCMPQEP